MGRKDLGLAFHMPAALGRGLEHAHGNDRVIDHDGVVRDDLFNVITDPWILHDIGRVFIPEIPFQTGVAVGPGFHLVLLVSRVQPQVRQQLDKKCGSGTAGPGNDRVVTPGIVGNARRWSFLESA